ncbi:alpha/beta hydrolase [Micromonospora sp. NBC_01796]|uniref:alpha/beta hydrolase n=1 Tax=Micromonospora sp. NBC_01796 TaxID=2975987 RepID=UPI002DDAB0FF|nr:alpha/beta hydrolase [Micromonospora sp. NBC_01796]WSA84906.1 alpha/beta hydrolase [Micromonospora sp. NBC_01796]
MKTKEAQTVNSISSRILTVSLTLAGVKRWQFAPKRFIGASAPPRDPNGHRPPILRHVTVERQDFENWPTYVVTPVSGGDAGQILYLHGGAYATEIGAGHWNLVARLAERTNRTVTVPIYPLTPEYGHRDVFPTLQRLYRRVAALGAADRLAVVGDSAGAGMALALVQSLPVGEARPGDLVLLSPWLDATMTNPDIPAIAPRDPLLKPAHLRSLGHLYALPDLPSVAEVSPINGPLRDLGRVTLFTGTRDVLNPDARRLRQLAADQGTDIVLREYPGMLHDWVLTPIPEARRVIAEIAEVLGQPQPAGTPAIPAAPVELRS